jgi:putative transposase
MPEHTHLLVVEAESNRTTLSKWVGWWKATSTKMAENTVLRWQKGFWDRRIRSEEMLTDRLLYMINNPVRRGLVENPEQWRYQGEIWPSVWRRG